ncbi:2,3-diaminopropionate biosynthesis protein SbnB [Streptacidiphilus sp. P02-A3a]|uniref:2,3-diaminopropionate biosynthesis protein SbnB n=1 Tax=Streptacidiphilus sp. P02-A3a TaxID=2704468 RepID=UPI0015F9E1D8|nr:2,3-diaminopropionate biosynthesis protein SbnB [Streptacidiphilus sp. P02-A3a]QMU71815.1 2,3-diaminopropionate biosynthesis protein SbnB [Streptacidiphilus sp. P02-A3a]
MKDFAVVPGAAVSSILNDSHHDILRIVAETYVAHEQKLSVNPDSYFLRFPGKPNSRVIALPSYLGGSVDTIGIKWIASFPDNVQYGRPRASAVLLLNDYGTGYPLACLEAAGISAARTAASAAVAIGRLVPAVASVSVGVIGAGVIARTITDYLQAHRIDVVDVLVHDLDSASANHLAAHARERLGVPATTGTLDEALAKDVVVFATTTAKPYVPGHTRLRPDQLLVNISLRDLDPELILACNNIVDDVDHCLKAQTSPHLAEQLSGSRDFVTGTLGSALKGDLVLDPDKATVFSPFGLGILDLAVGHYVLGEAERRGSAIAIPDFIGETSRW